MPTYMVQFSYTTEAWAALAKNPEDRGAPVAALMEKLGGRLLDIYYTFGEQDGVVICELPGDITALASVFAVIVPGHLKKTKTTRLFSMEEAMQAMRKADDIAYAAPKG